MTRLRILAAVCAISTLGLIYQSSAQDAKPAPETRTINVGIKRSATEIISFRVNQIGEFECRHLWDREIPSMTITDLSPSHPKPWSKKTETMMMGILSAADLQALTQAYDHLELKTIVGDANKEGVPEETPTWVTVSVTFQKDEIPKEIPTIACPALFYKTEYKKYGANAAKVEPFVKEVLTLTEHLK